MTHKGWLVVKLRYNQKSQHNQSFWNSNMEDHFNFTLFNEDYFYYLNKTDIYL